MSKAIWTIYDADYNKIVGGTQTELEAQGIVLAADTES